jgi:hypothetical protein
VTKVRRAWTAIVQWPEGDTEEVDCLASTKIEAEREIEIILKDAYLPGWKIIDISARQPGMSYP